MEGKKERGERGRYKQRKKCDVDRREISWIKGVGNGISMRSDGLYETEYCDEERDELQVLLSEGRKDIQSKEERDKRGYLNET